MGHTSFLGRANALDISLAAFAAGAFGFAAFALPEWRLNQLVLGSGLADVFSPARPPLGLKATLGIAGLAALLAFAGSMALLLLAGKAGPRKRATTDADAAPEPIRLRRADAHPDAPMRRPLVAGRDLGEPPREELVLDRGSLSPEPGHAHPFLVRQEPETVEMEPVPDAGDEELEPLVWEPELARSSARQADPSPMPEPVTESEGEAQATEPAREPDPQPQTIPAAIAEPEPQPAPEPEAPAEIGSVSEPIAVPAPPMPVRALPDILPDDPAPEASISTLMQRLEFGLARKERSAPLDPSAVAAPRDEAVGHRLRSAINDLQKLAARS